MYIIICRKSVFKHTGCTLVAICVCVCVCVCAAVSKYNGLVLFVMLFHGMEDVYKKCAIILKIYLCLTIPYVFRSSFS